MPLLNNGELTSIRLSIINDLEKTLKIVYKHQYRNILSKIVSNKKRFIKKRMPLNESEDMFRYNSQTAEITGYLSNLFDVFGDSAVLNAKKTFEANGLKWGKKLRKKLSEDSNPYDIYYTIKSLYIYVPDMDYIEMSDGGLVWHFNKLDAKFQTDFYNIKSAWLHSFIKSFTSQYTGIFEKKSEDEKKILTSIELKEDQ